MFGPNFHYATLLPNTFCHRSAEASRLCGSVNIKLQKLFGLEEFDLLFIPGPGTVAMQAVIQSLACEVRVDGGGKFERRWRDMVDTSRTRTAGVAQVYCLLETSKSERTRIVPLEGVSYIVDAVSGFPFYTIPSFASAFVTTSNKQLGAPPGISIVGVRRDCWPLFTRHCEFSYLDLHRHRGRFATTAPVHVLQHLDATLTPEFFARQAFQIETVSEALVRHIPTDCLIGDRSGPVITVRRKPFCAYYPGVAPHFELYPSNDPDCDRYHIFTYSEPAENYQPLIESLSHVG